MLIDLSFFAKKAAKINIFLLFIYVFAYFPYITPYSLRIPSISLFDTINIALKNEPIASLNVWLGKKNKVDVVVSEDLYFTVPKRKKNTITKKARGNDKESQKIMEVINIATEYLAKGIPARNILIKNDHVNVLKDLNLSNHILL